MTGVSTAYNTSDGGQILARSSANLMAKHTTQYATGDSASTACITIDFNGFHICYRSAFIAYRLRGLANESNEDESEYAQ